MSRREIEDEYLDPIYRALREQHQRDQRFLDILFVIMVIAIPALGLVAGWAIWLSLR